MSERGFDLDDRYVGIEDLITLLVGVIVLLGSLALDAYGVWAIPKELKLAIITGAAATVFGEKMYKMRK